MPNNKNKAEVRAYSTQIISSQTPCDMRNAEKDGFDIVFREGQPSIEVNRVNIVLPEINEKAVEMAAEDLENYIKTACPDMDVKLISADKVRVKDADELVILVGGSRINPQVRKLKDSGTVSGEDVDHEEFAIHTLRKTPPFPGWVVVLEANSVLAVQYAIYHWAEKVLGARYLNPFFEYVPRWKKLLLSSWNIRQKPRYQWRRLWLWCYVSDDWDWEKNTMRDELWLPWQKISNDCFSGRTPIVRCKSMENVGNDPSIWFLRGYKYNDPSGMNCVADWAIKNKNNAVSWQNEWLDHCPRPTPGCYTQHEIMRGLYTMAWASTGHGYGINYKDPQVKENLCGKGRMLCASTDYFYKFLEEVVDIYDQPPGHKRRIIGFTTNSAEGPRNVWVEGYGRCPRCINVPGWERERRIVWFVEELLRKKGRKEPVGIQHFWQNAPAPLGYSKPWIRRIVDMLPADGYIEIRPTGDHPWQEQGAWAEEAARRNREEGTDIWVFHQCENILMMGSDFPLVAPTYFMAREHDYEDQLKYPIIRGIDCNVYSTFSLEWLKTYFSLKNQWGDEFRWKVFLKRELSHLFGRETGEDLVQALDLLVRLTLQELLWKNTPYNKDVKSWVGSQFSCEHYLDRIFLDMNFKWPPESMNDEMVFWLQKGVTVSGGSPRRSFQEFFEETVVEEEKAREHYLELLKQYWQQVLDAKELLKRNEELFKNEFFRPLEWTYLYFNANLALAKGYCAFIRAQRWALYWEHELKTMESLEEAIAWYKQSEELLGKYCEIQPYWDWVVRGPPLKEIVKLRHTAENFLGDYKQSTIVPAPGAREKMIATYQSKDFHPLFKSNYRDL